MEPLPTETRTVEWVMFVIGGIAAIGAILSGFLWNFILIVKGEVMNYIRSVKTWGQIEHDNIRSETKEVASIFQKKEEFCQQHMLDIERRFSLKSEVAVLSEHFDEAHMEISRQMNQRFDQLTAILINQRSQI